MCAAQMVRCQGAALRRGLVSHAKHAVLINALFGNIASLLQLAHRTMRTAPPPFPHSDRWNENDKECCVSAASEIGLRLPVLSVVHRHGHAAPAVRPAG